MANNNSGVIDELVSQSALDQLEAVSTALSTVDRQIIDLASNAKKIELKFSSSADLKSTITAVNQATKAMADMNNATKLQTQLLKQQQSLQESLLKNELLAAKAKKESAAAALNQAKAEKELTKQIIDEDKYTAWLSEQKDKLEKKTLKAAENARKEADAYEQLKRKYKEVSQEAKNLSAQYGVNSVEAKKANDEAARMSKQLSEIEQRVGQFQRQVGNYATATMAFSQVLREAPAFANSFATGMMAISNNIPILVDEINKLKAANAAAAAAGEATIPVWKALWGAIASPVGLITIATTAATFIAANWKSIQGNINATTLELDKYNKKLKDIGENIYSGAESEIAQITTLLNLAKNTTVSYENRLKAVKKLQEDYPAYLGNLDKEKILTGQTTEAVQELTNALLAKSVMQAAEKKAAAAGELLLTYKAQIRAIDEMQQKEQAAATQRAFRTSGGGLGISVGMNDAITFDPRRAAMFENQRKPIQEKIDKIKADQEQYFKDASDFAAKSAGLLFNDTLKKQKTVKEAYDKELNGKKALIKAQFELDIQQIRDAIERDKAIMDNEDLSLQHRLEANTRYQTNSIILAQETIKKEIEIEQEGIDTINKKLEDAKDGKLKISNAEKQSLIDTLKAHNLNIKRLQQQAEKEKQDILINNTNAVIDITTSANDKAISDTEKAYNKQMLLLSQKALKEQNKLDEAYLNRELTQKQFQKKSLALQREYEIQSISSQIDYLKTLLENETLNDDQRADLEKKLLDAQNKLRSVTGKSTDESQKSGKEKRRITDPIAEALASDKLNYEQLLQFKEEFYNSSVQLAQNAAAMIIEAQNAEYENAINNLNRQKEHLKTVTDQKIEAIQSTNDFEENKNKKVQELQAQQWAAEKEIDAKRRKLEKEKADYQKKVSIANVIAYTAQGIAAVWANQMYVANPILGAIMTALIGANGIAQIAKINSAPTPAYKHGTQSHKGGYFFAGDGGEIELITPPDKDPYWSSDKTTLYKEKAGTKVEPISKIIRNAQNSVNAGNYASVKDYVLKEYGSAVFEKIASKINDNFEEVGDNIVKAIYRSRPNVTVNVVSNEYLNVQLKN